MKRPHYHFISLFPETINPWLTTSMIKRAHENGLFEFSFYQLRDFANNKHRSVDDIPFGGGGGMVLRLEPLVEAVEAIREQIQKENPPRNSKVIYFTPAGRPLTQNLIEEYSKLRDVGHLILVCGHYEGVDQRFIDHWVDDEISLGDFVLTGGELPAVAFVDALTRRLDGALGCKHGSATESFLLTNEEGSPLIEYSQYTRPSEFRGHQIPSILKSGNHKEIEQWRRNDSISRTRSRRPDLLSAANFDRNKYPSLE